MTRVGLTYIALLLLFGACGDNTGNITPDLQDTTFDIGSDTEPFDAITEEAAEITKDPIEDMPQVELPLEVQPEVKPCECLKDEDCLQKARSISSCEKMVCDLDQCECKAVYVDGVECDDGNPCTSPDICEQGTCKSGQNTCECTNDSDCAVYEDDDRCNGTLYCDKSIVPYVCKVNPKTVVKCEDDLKLPCKTRKCDKATGECLQVVINEGEPCDDKSLCSIEPKCVQGECVPTSYLKCDDGNPCTSDACVFGKGCTYIPNTLPCDDGEPCTVNDICSNGECKPGEWDSCDDNNECTSDICIAGKGCEHERLTGTSCDDHDMCTEGDICLDGACISGPLKNCDDANPCTDDSCDPKTGCVHVNNTATCDDHDMCTGPDLCTDGICTPGPVTVDCDDENLCTIDRCEPDTGECLHEAVICADKNPCTDDYCEPSEGCVHVPVDCSDDDPCTIDACISPADAPECIHTPIDCDDQNPCTKDVCVNGECKHLEDAGDCNACEVPVCDPQTGKRYCLPKDCNDHNLCTIDYCDLNDGECYAIVNDCNDQNPCTDDRCDDSTGLCEHIPNTALCSAARCDGLIHYSDSFCSQGFCQPIVMQDCDDRNPCTDDSCDPDNGCNHTPLSGVVCAPSRCDGTVYFEASMCFLGWCIPPMSGQQCDDNVFCNGSESCMPEIGCISGEPPSCDDGVDCTEDSCDETLNQCIHEWIDGRVEGPADDPTCTDGLDNDCDDLIDMDDPDCN